MARTPTAADLELADMTLALADQNDPETRRAFAALVRKKGLKNAAGQAYTFPDVDAIETNTAEAKRAAKEILDEERQQAAAAATVRRLEAQRQKLVDEGRFDADGVKKLEAFMEARGFSDYEDAAIVYNHHNPPTATPSEIASRGLWELPTGDWAKDPTGTARRLANEAVRDIMAARGR